MKAKFVQGDKVRLNGTTPKNFANGNHPTGKVTAITHRGERRLYSLHIRDKGKGFQPFVTLRSYQIDPLVSLPNGRPSRVVLRQYHNRVKRYLRYEIGSKVAKPSVNALKNKDIVVTEYFGIG